MDTFEIFNNGKLVTPAATKDFSSLPWSKHPVFTGVELKHILTSKKLAALTVTIWYGFPQTAASGNIPMKRS